MKTLAALREPVMKLLEKRVRKKYLAEESSTNNGEPLTEEEKKEVNNLWGITDYKSHEMFKLFSGFDARFVPNIVYSPRFLRVLNPVEYARVFADKSLYDTLHPTIPQPQCYVKNIGGGYRIEDKVVSVDKAIEYINSLDYFIIKPTIDTGCGLGVRFVDTKKVDVRSIISVYKKDFMAQEVLQQSQQTAVFHAKSLNTFRITTLNINGKASLCNILFRCGRGESVVDNGGAGGFMCGVSPMGQFEEIAYDKYFKKYSCTEEGVKFGEHRISSMPSIVETVLKWHAERLPMLGIAGWDIALDVEDKPRMLEVNLRCPRILFEQMCSRTPLFGDRTQEVIDYVNSRPFRFIDALSVG